MGSGSHSFFDNREGNLFNVWISISSYIKWKWKWLSVRTDERHLGSVQAHVGLHGDADMSPSGSATWLWRVTGPLWTVWLLGVQWEFHCLWSSLTFGKEPFLHPSMLLLPGFRWASRRLLHISFRPPGSDLWRPPLTLSPLLSIFASSCIWTFSSNILNSA